jgi:hypothetical protein
LEWIDRWVLAARLGIHPDVVWRRRELFNYRRESGKRRGARAVLMFEWPHAHGAWREWERNRTGARVLYTPSDDSMWLLRNVPLVRIAPALGADRKSFARQMGKRGWKWGFLDRPMVRGRFQGSRSGVVKAPCAECGTSTGVASLSRLRECERCRGAA